MNIISPFIYIFYASLVIIAFGSVALAYNLHKRYPFKYLSDFFYYLIAIYFYWFVIIVLPDLLLSILKEDIESRYTTLYWLFTLFSLPCFFIGLYFFISLFIHLRKEKIPKWVSSVYALSAIALIVGLGLSLKFSLGQANPDVIGNYYVIVKSFALVVRLAVIAYAFFGSIRCNNTKKKQLIQTLAVYYFAGFVINSVGLDYLPVSRDILFYLSPLIYVLLNIPPLFFLQKYAKMIFKDRLLAQEDKINFDRIFQKYGLSKREQEIFILMLEGKSNKEIAEDLFISVKTVKNHIYSIFQKLGVNSRIKLYVFIRNLADNQ